LHPITKSHQYLFNTRKRIKPQATSAFNTAGLVLCPCRC
jgi:hypothetical protein